MEKGLRWHIEVTLTAEGVYDYFCASHEHAGIVGRLIVVQPSGPGSLLFDWFRGWFVRWPGPG